MTTQARPAGSKKKSEKVFGQWIRTDERVGKGGQGDLFKAYRTDDTERVRPLVLKQLRNPERAGRFAREVKAALTLEHPGIVKVEGWDLDLERPFLITPFYRDGHLTKERAQTMAPAEKLRFFAAVCRAVGYAHDKGVVHRDMKPENILIADDGSPIVADFGLCYFKDGSDQRDTETLEQAGSRFYMAPELADGRAVNVTARADVYSLGKLAYWMFAGTIFDREKLRVGIYDLTKTEPRGTHSLLYQLLERMILERPEDRLPDGNAAAGLTQMVAERVAMDAHMIDLDAPQQCHYCRSGDYKLQVDPRWWFPELNRPETSPNEWLNFATQRCQRYGLHGPSGPWLVLECAHCGNIQTFCLHESEPLKNWKVKK